MMKRKECKDPKQPVVYRGFDILVEFLAEPLEISGIELFLLGGSLLDVTELLTTQQFGEIEKLLLGSLKTEEAKRFPAQ